MRIKAALLPLVSVLALSTLSVSAPAIAAVAEPVDREIVLAKLGYTNGVSVSFTIDEKSRDYGLSQDGEVGRNQPVLNEKEERSYLEAYLTITPRTVAVPKLIVDSHPSGKPVPADLAYRRITTSPVYATGLTAPNVSVAAVSCYYQHYDWVQWYDPAGSPDPDSQFHAAKNFEASDFGGMREFADSLIVNCGPANVRHRIYWYSVIDGVYYKHWDSVVTPNHWQAKEKGSVLRWRYVRVDAGWGYTRAGRFHN
ncbi:hypothetical protein [Catelliglobosispora koreensis]|uniref:hypothetical protein n=1 Tax=Catelliglobosispora koreensis TaxID=129052 RepID=UPI00036B4FD3|nr:hypothetical protein [Catelliglobosispora koreensis]